MTSDGVMETMPREFFKNLFQSNSPNDPSHILSDEINLNLLAPYTIEEVLSSIKDMGPTKASRVDGFSTLIFQKYQSIVGRDVTNFYLKALNKGTTLDDINFTNIMLIPKTTQPSNLKDFRSINLCNVLYKIIFKMMVNNFKGVLDKCIDESQGAFFLGHLIFDNILLPYEILYTYKNKKERNDLWLLNSI